MKRRRTGFAGLSQTLNLLRRAIGFLRLGSQLRGRLPLDVKTFLRGRADDERRTMSFVLVDIVRMYMNYLSEQAKQPKVKK